MLETVANNITGETEMNDLLIKLLELFCQIGVKLKEQNERLTKNSQKVMLKIWFIFVGLFFKFNDFKSKLKIY